MMRHSNGSSPHVLLSAYQCGPGMGSVSQIGWEWYSRLAKKTKVTLVTHVRNKATLEKAGTPLGRSQVIFIDTEWFAGPLYRSAAKLFPRSEHAVFLLSSLDFYVHDFHALRTLRRYPKNSWDVVHAVTPVSPLASTRLYKLRRPLILGPWNGGMTSPSTFPEIMKADSGWIYRIRVAGRAMDRIIGCSKHASVILSATKATDESIPAEAKPRARRMIENGVDLQNFHPGEWKPNPGRSIPLKIIFVGRLIPAKGLPLLFEAISQLRGEMILELTVVGDGPLRVDLQNEIHRRSLQQIVTFTGNLPLAEVAQRIRNAHVFCLPSIRESGGAVLLEAMACAVPVVAVDFGGPAEIVDDEVGRLVSSAGPQAMIADLIAALRDIVRDPESWQRRGIAGRKRAEKQYGWDAKIDEALSIYRQFSQTKGH